MPLSDSSFETQGLRWLCGCVCVLGGGGGGGGGVGAHAPMDRCLPKSAHQLFSFELLGFSDTEVGNYKNAHLSH